MKGIFNKSIAAAAKLVPSLGDGSFGVEMQVQARSADFGKPWIPWAVDAYPRMKTAGLFAGGWPRFLVLHYTAGSDNVGAAIATHKQGVTNGFAYLSNDWDGTLYQGHPINRWGGHCGGAGKSGWPGERGGMNDKSLGLETCSPGKLEAKNGQYYAWYDTRFTKPIPLDNRRYVTEAEYGCPTGWYKKFSNSQESTIIRLCKYVKENDPTGRFTYDNVLAHHEVSGKKGIGYFRKSDQGGCMSMSMDQLRKRLKDGTI